MPQGEHLRSIPLIETERLRLRASADADLDGVAAMCADGEVMRFLGDGRTLDREDAWRQMAMFMGHWALRGFGIWAVEEQSSAYVGARRGVLPGRRARPRAGLGARAGALGEGLRDRGGARGARSRVRALGRDRVISLIHRDSVRSIRVAERLGERYEGQVVVRGHTADVYAVTREAWSERSGRAARG